jgi:hypothetical protein
VYVVRLNLSLHALLFIAQHADLHPSSPLLAPVCDRRDAMSTDLLLKG